MIGPVIFGTLLCLVLLLCLSRIRLEGKADNGEITAAVCWWFIRIPLWPRPEKEKKGGKKEKKEAKKSDPAPSTDTEVPSEGGADQPAAQKAGSAEKGEAQSPGPVRGARRKKDLAAQNGESAPNGKSGESGKASKDLKDTLTLILDLVRSAVGPLKMLLRYLWVNRIDLHLIVAREDAAETAIAYGQMNGWLVSAFAALSQMIHMKNERLLVQADYLSRKDRLTVSLVLTLRVGVILGAGIWFGVSFVKRLIKGFFARDGKKADLGKEKKA